MSSCLGLYIENNIIKYAKVTKDHDNIKIDSFGIKFYDNVEETIKQIVGETYSYKTPISVNLSDEKYTYANLFSLLNKNDLQKAVKTEFDYFCNENNKNRNALEYRYLLSPNLDDKDKITTLYAYSDKSNIVRKLQILDGYKVTNISPLPMIIQNLSNDNEKTSAAIINIEKNTSVTFIVNGQIQRVEAIEIGMRDVFENIIQKENSYSKAYEICKNTTIYTMQGRNLQVEENEYMEDIMPVLYNIVERTKDIIRSSGLNIEDIYISGLATSINNIDLYFQENFPDKKCEILVPYFVQKTNIKLNIKDYIEVNSAIALALQGLGIGNKAINFKNKSLSEQISQALNIEFGKNPKEPKEKKETKESSKSTQKLKSMFKFDFGQSLDNIEKGMLRAAVGILILIIIYGISTSLIMNQIKNKDNEVLAYIGDTEKEISKITNNTSLISSRKEQYKELVDKINQENDKLTQSYARKNALPNFLTQVMYNIPKEVQLISIRNSADKGITIQAQSKVYEQLGYFIAKIKNEGILTGVTATSGQQQGEFIVITIEGNLPY